MKHYILDTYNISSLLGREGTEKKAVYFLVTLIRYYSLKHPSYTISLVLDGAAPQEFMLPPNAKVIESGAKAKADDIIKDLIDTEKDRPNCTVVSSDLEVHSYARILGCKAMKSDDFLDKLQINYTAMTGSKHGSSEKPIITAGKEKKKLMDEFSRKLDDREFAERYKEVTQRERDRPLSVNDFKEEPPVPRKKKQKAREVLHMADKKFSMSEEEMKELLKLFGGDEK